MVKRTWCAELLPGKLPEYQKLHDEIWPEMIEMFQKAGVRNYTIWNTGNLLFGYFECDDPSLLPKVEAETPCMEKWKKITAGLVKFKDAETDDGLRKVFELI